MVAQKILLVVIAALVFTIAVVQSSPVPVPEDNGAAGAEAIAVSDENIENAERDGRFYGVGGSQASAIAVASANAGATGLGGGYPYGGGYGSYGYPYGK